MENWRNFAPTAAEDPYELAFIRATHPCFLEHPDGTLMIIVGMAHDDYEAKSWDEFASPDAPELDFVFTVCDQAAQEACPFWPGQPISAHWGVPDPVAVDGNEAEQRLAFADAYRMLYNRISIFVNLPIESLDRLALQRHLDEIGRNGPDGGRETGDGRRN